MRRPKNGILISTYAKLEQYLHAFASGHLNLLILVGEAGLAKTRTVRQILGDSACWIEGNATPFGMFLKLYRHRDRFVVIDDVDSLYADRAGIRLLKCLCQTEEQKVVAWQSGARSLEKEGVPRDFVTTSKVIIICNDWKTLNRNVAALEDRGHVLVFEPTAKEVHQKTGEWFGDKEIYKWFEGQLPRIVRPSMRWYVRAAELKKAKMNWMDAIPVAPKDRRRQLAAELKADESFTSEEQRAQQFTARGGGCRATYFNHARKLKTQ